ncbi:hypothetical protein ACNI3T_01280 [Christiangramia sp. ASW11-125]|uniref:hypothetical protein n=1 Tax=Christiangramia sp. ASW11-125 TaxID=3400701 RepID=UPI003AACA950
MKNLLILLSVLFLTGCSSDDETISDTAIEGIWEKTSTLDPIEFDGLDENLNYEYVIQYKFLDNGKFESFTFIRAIDTSEIAGYMFKELGTFTISNNRLSLVSDRWISQDDSGALQSLQELSLNEGDIEWSFNFELEQNTLTFIFDPCGPAENCIGSITLNKVK